MSSELSDGRDDYSTGALASAHIFCACMSVRTIICMQFLHARVTCVGPRGSGVSSVNVHLQESILATLLGFISPTPISVVCRSQS